VARAFLLCSLWHLGWRATTLNPQACIFSWVLYAAELFGFLTASLHLFMTWWLTRREPPPVPPGMSIDVFIPTINESEAIVRRSGRRSTRRVNPTVAFQTGSTGRLHACIRPAIR
jgi:cellulose synthase (UDP-forming)